MNWALDTNVLVRHLVQDDGPQSVRVEAAMRRALERGHSLTISLPVLLETEWVLRSRYGFMKAEILQAFRALLDSFDICIDQHHVLTEALHVWADSRADFADCLFASHHRRLGCNATWTFDARALRVPGFVPLP
jgi:predicted nucleic-acid-binding protein